MITVSPIFVDRIKIDMYVPGRVTEFRKSPRLGYGTNNLAVVLTVLNNDGTPRDLSDVSSATVHFTRGDGTEITKTGTVDEDAGTVASEPLTSTSDITPIREGQWYVTLELATSGGASLFSGRRECFYFVDTF